MPDFNFVLLHVRDHVASATLYHALLGSPIVEQKADIAILPLRDGVMLGLWSSETVEPESTGLTGASELAFTVADANAVDRVHADWSRRGLTIVQAPTSMAFGTTFVACDPDGHRLRVFAPAAV
ncbi:putative enzyme related to lactoylglutathione lyase [Sphingomonas insulae]|uniref:VOC family protein n=1 Tax=Sphingomonas insulae TaxID=424800 RepID=A0ABN1HK94_9SPHN|nr:VOC family protein [Sphingomonas insulae]NIJ30462.1 putative enzyme related to lactoylglutathione lyase [Sphingomonas insulae]